jgi:preprotein translocase subunit SecG
MLFTLLVSIYSFVCFLLILLILIQRGKGSMGIGNLGGGAQMLFGGSGGQDLFQKITWGLGVIFVGGSLCLSMLKTQNYQTSRYLPSAQTYVFELPINSALFKI